MLLNSAALWLTQHFSRIHLKRRLAPFPIRHSPAEKILERRTVVVMAQMAKLVGQDVVNAFSGSSNQRRIEEEDAGWRAATPLATHRFEPKRWRSRAIQ